MLAQKLYQQLFPIWIITKICIQLKLHDNWNALLRVTNFICIRGFISQKKPLDCHSGPIHYVYNETFQPNLTASKVFLKKSEMKQNSKKEVKSKTESKDKIIIE